MKKIILFITLLLALVMMIPTMISCDGEEAEETIPETTEAVVEETEAPKPEPSSSPMETSLFIPSFVPTNPMPYSISQKNLSKISNLLPVLILRIPPISSAGTRFAIPRHTRSFSASPITMKPQRL